MEKNRTVQRKKNKRKGRPKLRFNFGVMLLLCILSFIICFVMYMMTANVNENFLDEMMASESETIGELLPGEEDAADVPESAEDEPDTAFGMNPVPQSKAADKSYLKKCCLVTDSTMLGLAKGFGADNMIGSDRFNAVNCNVIDADGVKIAEKVKEKDPEAVYIMLGSDISTAAVGEMVNGYSALIRDIRAALPKVAVYVMQYPPIAADTETLTNDMINQYNAKLLDMCNELEVYCIDTNTAMKSELGTLKEEYSSPDGTGYSAEGYSEVIEYILTHTK